MASWIKENVEGLYHLDVAEDTVFFLTASSEKELLTIQESFQEAGGWYIFLEEKNREVQEVLELEKQLLLRAQEGGMVWVPKGSVSPYNWTIFSWKPEGEYKFLVEGVVYQRKNFRLRIKSGTRVYCREERFEFEQEKGLAVFLNGRCLVCAGKFVMKWEADEAGVLSLSDNEPFALEITDTRMMYGVSPEAGTEDVISYSFQPFSQYEQSGTREYLFKIDFNHLESGTGTYITVPVGGIESNFYTLYGGKVVLESTQTSRIVLERQALWEKGDYLYYPAPSGEYCLKAEGQVILPCSQNGVEYVVWEGEGRIRFVPGKPAYANRENLRLNADLPASVPWISAWGKTGSSLYYSHPRKSAFFKLAQSGEPMEYLPVPFAIMDENAPVSLLPLEGMINDASDREEKHQEIAWLDEQILSRERNEVMMNTLDALSGKSVKVFGLSKDQSYQALSEQGMQICYSAASLQENRFERVEFSESFYLENVKGKLKGALLSNSPLLLLESGSELSKWIDIDKSGFALQMDGWEFDLGLIEGSSTFWIIKYGDNVSISEAAEHEEFFQLITEGGRRKLKDMMVRTNQLAKESEVFEELLAILENPKWCGVLAFHVPVSGEKLPQEVAFLTDSIPEGQLCAFYLAFHQRRASEEAAVDGLIYYEAPMCSVEERDVECFFRTEKLEILFKDNFIRSFYATASLTVKELFGSRVIPLNTTTGASLLFEGVYQRSESGMGSYVFTLKQPVWYEVISSVIENICIHQGRIMAEAERKMGFFLDGILKFRAYSFDFFGYGEEEEGLHFTGYEFIKDGEKYWSIYDSLVFDEEKSRMRQGSFNSQFPIKIAGFRRVSEGDVTPEKLGYSGIYVEGITQEALSESWSGFVWRLSFGELGALAKYMDIGLEFLTAFSATQSDKTYDEQGNYSNFSPKLFVGIRSWDILPVQNIMKLGFGSVELRLDERGGYYLFLRNFALRVLGITMPEGNNDLYLLGNPKGDGSNQKLAWYAAYEKNSEKNT